jgi:hypothetical protein
MNSLVILPSFKISLARLRNMGKAFLRDKSLKKFQMIGVCTKIMFMPG